MVRSSLCGKSSSDLNEFKVVEQSRVVDKTNVLSIMVGVLHGGGGGVSHLVVSDSAAPWTVAHQAPLSMMGCYTHLQGIFLTQGSNPGLLHCRQILYHLNHHDVHQ